MTNYELVVGLEIHLKINSRTKLFCACSNIQDVHTKPNTHICPVCSGQPGALPVLQQEPVEKALLLARALQCEIRNPSQFDRKSYFYPDLPTGYQITQYFHPYAHRGQVSFFSEDFATRHIAQIREAHLEIDAGKSIHEGDSVYIDFNRAGTPLVEVVTEPDFRTADEVAAFLKELQRIAQYNDISDANMEKGQLRVDVNISVRPRGQEAFGTRVEIKNMNSFSAIKKAISIEYDRQVALLEAGEQVVQSTRGWDEQSQSSFLMRSKESALDYRYFPEPDLPPLLLNEALLDAASGVSLVIPAAVVDQYQRDYGFHKEYINVLLGSASMYRYFSTLVDHGVDPRLAAKRLAGPVAAYCKDKFVSVDELPFGVDAMMVFLQLVADETISNNQAKKVIKLMLESGKAPATIVSELGFDQAGLNADALLSIGEQVVADNPGVVEQYRGGKVSAMGFFVGQVMRAAQGQATPQDVKTMLEGLLS